MFAMYLIWYGFGRMLIEGLRTDSLYMGSFRISQLVGGASFVLGLVIVFLNAAKCKKAAEKAVAYDSVYDRLHPTVTEATEENKAVTTEETIEENNESEEQADKED